MEGWERPQLNIRLTARRKQLLLRIAEGAPAAGSPQRAFDRALDLATAALDETEASCERLAEVEAAVREMARAQSSDAASFREQLAAISKSLQDLRALIADVAAGE